MIQFVGIGWVCEFVVIFLWLLCLCGVVSFGARTALSCNAYFFLLATVVETSGGTRRSNWSFHGVIRFSCCVRGYQGELPTI